MHHKARSGLRAEAPTCAPLQTRRTAGAPWPMRAWQGAASQRAFASSHAHEESINRLDPSRGNLSCRKTQNGRDGRRNLEVCC
jgi:hypothetical protein